MPIKCILLYKLPKGVLPVKEDAERIITALTQQLYCVPTESARGLGRDGAAAVERQVEAIVSIFRQLTAPDPSLIAEPRSLREVWMVRLQREAPSKVFLLLKTTDGARVTEAEPSIRTFLEKRLEYRQRFTVAIHSQAWSMGDKHSDVTVKLLQVLQQGQTPKVLAVELTYHPAVELATGIPVLEELAERLAQLVAAAPPGRGNGQGGALQLLQPRYDDQLPATYGPMHIVEAYNELLVEGLSGRG